MATKQKNRPICFKHDDVLDLCDDISKLLDNNKIDKKKISSKLKEIMQVTLLAKTDGQSMENRLSEYRDAIERLGFKRDK